MRKIRSAKSEEKIVDDNVDSFAVLAKYTKISCEVEMQNISNPRASSLYSACMRMQVIGVSLKLKQKRFLNLHSRVTFGTGNAIHYQIQNSNWVFSDNMRVGWWLCTACKKIRQFGRRKTSNCEFCNALPEASIYYEHSLSVHKNPVLVTGHPDLLIYISKGVVRIVEIKTIKKDSYENLIMPLIEHQWQIITYLMYCNKSTIKLPIKIDESLGYILYLAKEQTGRDVLPLRLFPVSNSLVIQEQIKAKLRLYYEGIQNFPKKLPPVLAECERSNFSCWKAKNCAAVSYCKENS